MGWTRRLEVGKIALYMATKSDSGNPVELSGPPVSLEEVHLLCGEATAGETGLTLLKGFKLDFSANPDFHKVYLSVSCDCGTAALLSLEVAKSKTRAQVEEVLPGLVQHLKGKVGQFRAMSCEMHTAMRTGRPDAGAVSTS